MTIVLGFFFAELDVVALMQSSASLVTGQAKGTKSCTSHIKLACKAMERVYDLQLKHDIMGINILICTSILCRNAETGPKKNADLAYSY